MRYWQECPPTHVTLAAVARAFASPGTSNGSSAHLATPDESAAFVHAFQHHG